ncbi:hypothetical protein ID855_03095 [Xenorhabdus sp. ZM]|uniref:hypothetical protein n=1 Tax=Xenorhabdus szentirmaii TaxID=290112 RepID=UPI0019987727|nr:hypothetical protein [Xenorhabdus sp. ZM]MBD2803709.1 hypothetical protein [Xenorhabdus sp. ZM]
MDRNKYNEKFTKFPYKTNIREDGINNGGIDLTKEPHRIDEIHEIQDYPFMKKILLNINAKNQTYMTFGCDFGILNDNHCGYIDFSYRPDKIPADYTAIRNLDNDFYRYLSNLDLPWSAPGSPVDYAKNALRWEYSGLVVYDSPKYEKVSLWMRAKEYEALEWLATYVHDFLIDHH